ncbi:glycosyltransferase [Pseudonocardia lutea]|uniref:Glycosyltransferase n=1 Tax=Pseudonocardia lutea TaxID=2172015 RepID=A0ABW1I1V8_9PSEU
MRIFGWAADNGGCGYYRVKLPLDTLRSLGHETLTATVMPDEWQETADVIVGQRVCNPGPTSRWQKLAREGSAKLVFEVDDDLLNVHHSNRAGHAFFKQPEIRQNLTDNITVADLVTVTNEHLAERVSAFNPNVAILPNYIPAAMLDLPTPPEAERLTVGWAGSATHRMDWEEAAEPIAKFMVKGAAKHLDMHFIGDLHEHWFDFRPWDKLGGRIRRSPWVQRIPDYHAALDFHIGLAPLKPHVFNLSKSPIKALEYAARGIPVIASDFGPYAAFVQDGETGVLVRERAGWAAALWELSRADGPRRQMSKAAQELARAHTIEGNAWRWERALSV